MGFSFWLFVFTAVILIGLRVFEWLFKTEGDSISIERGDPEPTPSPPEMEDGPQETPFITRVTSRRPSSLPEGNAKIAKARATSCRRPNLSEDDAGKPEPRPEPPPDPAPYEPAQIKDMLSEISEDVDDSVPAPQASPPSDFIVVAERAVPLLVTAGIAIAALFIILKGTYDDSTQKWAYGSIGMVFGHWVASKKK